jgi:glycerate 2-kinase
MVRVEGLEDVDDLVYVLDRVIEAVEPGRLLGRHVRRAGGRLFVDGYILELGGFDDFVVLAAGKASYPMAAKMLKLLEGRPVRGVAVLPHGYKPPQSLQPLETIHASHPTPDTSSQTAGQKILEYARSCGTRSLAFILLSGGASSLCVMPAGELAVEDKAAASAALMRAGASIEELNTVRKHLSAIKGGWLAKQLRCRAITLILSDVVGDRVDVIGSGPTAPDPTTYADALKIIARRRADVPERVVRHLEAGARGAYHETPKPGDPCFRNVRNIVVGGSLDAVKAAASALRRKGVKTLALTSMLSGEAREAALLLSAIARDIRRAGIPLKPPAAVVAGGETVVTVRGGGVGGRNQELALALATYLGDVKGFAAASMGTDGVDGPTDAAGAIVTDRTLQNAAEKNLNPQEYLENNDSHTFFKKVGGLIYTGPTGTNVGDITILLIRGSRMYTGPANEAAG